VEEILAGVRRRTFLDFSASIELRVLCPLEGRFIVFWVLHGEGKWVSMDHSKSKKHEGVAVFLTKLSNLLKKI